MAKEFRRTFDSLRDIPEDWGLVDEKPEQRLYGFVPMLHRGDTHWVTAPRAGVYPVKLQGSWHWHEAGGVELGRQEFVDMVVRDTEAAFARVFGENAVMPEVLKQAAKISAEKAFKQVADQKFVLDVKF